MRKFLLVFISGFFISIHYGTTVYINSSLLGNFLSSSATSSLFIAGAGGNILLFLFAPKLIRRFGKRVLLMSALALSALATLCLALVNIWWVVLIAFIVHASLLFINFYCLDIYLEELSPDARTGEIRGIYLTLISLGIALGPLALPALTASGDGLWLVYLAAVLLLVPPVLIALFLLKSSTPKKHEPYHHSVKLPFKTWWQTKNVRHVTLARMVLEAFYAFMIIYTPIYLHDNLSFEWSELGIIFSIMLVPFILFEWPAGEVADRFWGEKEIMTVGFVLMIASLLIMPFLGKIFLAWTVVLFISRVGASLVEVMTESYFFKQIRADDTALISIFRLARPVSIILGAAVGTLALNLFSFDKIFFVLALLVLIGLKEGLSLRDTR